jgi:hypothetical protein
MLKKIGRPVGRPRGSISKRRQMAQEVMIQLEGELGRQCNPLEALLRTGADTTQLLSIRVECWTQALPYLYPKLQSQALAVTTREDNGLDLACIEMERAMSTPDGVEIIQRAALLIAGQPDAIGPLIDGPDDGAKAPAQICGPDNEREREKEERGPWR